MAKTVNEENIKRDVARILDCVNTLSPLSNKMVGDSQDMCVQYSVGEQLGHIKDAANEILGQIGAAGTIGSSRKSIKSDYSDEEYWYPTPETKKVYRVVRLNPRTGQGYGYFDFDTREEAENFKRTLGRNTATYHVYIAEREVPLNSSSKKNSIKSSAERHNVPTLNFIRAFVKKLNDHCKEEFGDADPEFTRKYGPLYQFKVRETGKMSNDGWGNEYPEYMIYDDQGSLDWFEDEFLPKWIDEELGKSGFYAEPVGSSRFVIAVE